MLGPVLAVVLTTTTGLQTTPAVTELTQSSSLNPEQNMAHPVRDVERPAACMSLPSLGYEVRSYPSEDEQMLRKAANMLRGRD
jgi:hypothetical protein